MSLCSIVARFPFRGFRAAQAVPRRPLGRQAFPASWPPLTQGREPGERHKGSRQRRDVLATACLGKGSGNSPEVSELAQGHSLAGEGSGVN